MIVRCIRGRGACLPPEQLQGADLDALGVGEAARASAPAHCHARQQPRLHAAEPTIAASNASMRRIWCASFSTTAHGAQA